MLPLSTAHGDYGMLAPIVEAILDQSGGWEQFSIGVPRLIRQAIDEVIDAPRTNRFTLSEIEKTEKTYLGTKIEILFRAFLKLPKGRNLDLSIRGAEADIKNTMGGNWAIPMEAHGHPCVLIKESESKAICSVGVIVADSSYLNRDHKQTISKAGLQNVWWLLANHPYPPNFWERMLPAQRAAIMSAGGGTQRLTALFEAIQNTPISRVTVQAVGQQHDYMKRLRRNGGARDLLAARGISLLWGEKHREIIEQLNLGIVGDDEFISYRPTDPGHIALLRAIGEID
jgi:hypothetical protein